MIHWCGGRAAGAERRRPQRPNVTTRSKERAAGAGDVNGHARGGGDGAARDLALARIQDLVLWTAVRMVHHANSERPNPDGIKIGGHQASCASSVTILTSLIFDLLGPRDRLAVKPHASPVFHAIQYLLGEPRPAVPHHPSRLQGPPGLSQPHQRPRLRRLLDGLRGLGSDRAQLRLARRAVRARPLHRLAGADAPVRLHGRRRRARRGHGVGGGDRARPGHQPARALGRGREPAEPRPHHPRHPGSSLREMLAANGWRVIDAKYGSLLQEAFAAPKANCSERPSTRCPTRRTNACCASRTT